MRFYLFLTGFAILLCGCIRGGTHGYIKAYRYNVSKYTLEKAVNQVIEVNHAIHQDSVKGYYNNDSSYVTITVTQNRQPYTYTFRYYGGTEYWDTSKTSEIFIAYAYNAKHEGGSEGGKIKQHGLKFIQDLIQPFEKNLVAKIDGVLGMKHIEE